MEELFLIWAWLVVVPASLSYCYSLSSLYQPGIRRLLAVLPVIVIFSLLSFSFSSVHLRGISAFFLVWLSTFKLLLFAYDRGPLSGPLSLLSFVVVATLPVTVNHISPTSKRRTSPLTFLVFTAKSLLLGFIISLYSQRARFHRITVLMLYYLHMYLSLDLLLTGAVVVSLAALPAGTVLKPQFATPYLSTSLQGFWAQGWNLAVSRILRAAVYDPVRARYGPDLGRAAAFLVSGLMHEVMYFYLTLARPTGEVTAFFVLHGVCTAAEVAVKRRWFGKGWRPLPAALTAPLTIGFLLVTGLWLFLPQILRSDAEENIVGEAQAFLSVFTGAVRITQ